MVVSSQDTVRDWIYSPPWKNKNVTKYKNQWFFRHWISDSIEQWPTTWKTMKTVLVVAPLLPENVSKPQLWEPEPRWSLVKSSSQTGLGVWGSQENTGRPPKEEKEGRGDGGGGEEERGRENTQETQCSFSRILISTWVRRNHLSLGRKPPKQEPSELIDDMSRLHSPCPSGKTL